MSEDISGVASAYFAAANAFDIDRTVALFTEEALVKDEGKDIRGRTAIREWIERTMREYAAIATPEHVDVRDGGVAITALVSGTFPGSPARLTFRFTVTGERIAGLESH
jgi:ketosteroid isomerase-like protein